MRPIFVGLKPHAPSALRAHCRTGLVPPRYTNPMCGRYLRRSDKQRIAAWFRVHSSVDGLILPPDYNIAPTTFQPVVRLNRDTGERELVPMRWGLIPNFAKSLADYKGLSTINARAENIMAGLWKRCFERHRCLIPADGFYEWRTLLPELVPGTDPPQPSGKRKPAKPKPIKQPFVFTLARTAPDGEPAPMALAGVWDAWKDPATGDWLQSFAIVTTEANELMSTVHTRMPVILHARDWDRWLDRSANHQPPVDLLRPYESDEMAKAPVSPAVNNVRNNSAELLNPPEDPTAGDRPLNSA